MVRALYGFTIFIAAFLLFQVEPIIAKYLLPWFGGTPTVWTTCLLFFQVLLLGGYFYAHVVGTRLRPLRQVAIHLGLVGAAGAVLLLHAIYANSPVLPAAGWASTRVEFPSVRILILLSVSIGAPYLALSATAPLLQSWFARADPDSSPYRFYALSNLGSLLALLTYPFLVEPEFGLRAQADVWSILYVPFGIGIALCAAALRCNQIPESLLKTEDTIAPSRYAMAMWLALSACASMLLYAATGQLTQDVAPVPFLWIMPLALYLLSFIICFDNDRWYRRAYFQPLLCAAIVLRLIVAVYGDRITGAAGKAFLSQAAVGLAIEVPSTMLLMFAGCMVLNGELVRLKPRSQDLTSFYLIVSLGGAIGGVFSVVFAPLKFPGFWDFYFAVWSCVVLMTIALGCDRASWIYRAPTSASVAILAGALGLPVLLQIAAPSGPYGISAVIAVSFAALAVWRGALPPAFGRNNLFTRISMAVAVMVLGGIYLDAIAVGTHDTLWSARNFFGVLRVVGGDGPDDRWHSFTLMNGRVEHGKQFFSSAYPQLRYYPAGYYGTASGIGLVMMNEPKRGAADNNPLRVGIVGLGAGAIAAWGRPGDYFRFYEINPADIRVATARNGYFTYVHDSNARVRIVPGDARLSMERELQEGRPQHFDVLAIDAFSGDVIPTHLLTIEAMRVYLRELNPDGVIAVHISNRYLDLKPVLAEDSRVLNLRFGYVHAREKDMVNWASDWVLLARNEKVLGQPAIASHLEPRKAVPRIVPWTDDYSNLFQLLR